MDSKKILSPFHEGETEVQKRVGVLEEVNSWAPHAIRPFLTEQHQIFFKRLSFVIAAARDENGAPWATLLTGMPGFIQSEDFRILKVKSMPMEGDALANSFIPGAGIGLLGIELETRRRNRINGIISESNGRSFTFEVQQAYGNCPQYISKRILKRADISPEKVNITRHNSLNDHMKSWISRADTMFIASGYDEKQKSRNGRGMDVSHRGGSPGFVKIKSGTGLILPDYAGNNLFNTIGNLVVDSRVGLLILDFKLGSMLQITGNAEIDWDSEEIIKHPGAKRLINIEIEKIVQLDNSLPIRWSSPEGFIRELVLVDKIIESKDVTSFVFEPRDRGRLPLFKAGQYLPVELTLSGGEAVERTYSLSNPPGEEKYRISVKREPNGFVSRLLHDHLMPGNTILAKEPEGDFVLSQNKNKPVVLISAGIGITPMVSMLHVLAKEGRETYFIHGARNGSHSPLLKEVTALAQLNDTVNLSVIYSQPENDDVEGVDYNRKGHIDGKVIEEIVPAKDAEFYVCGPKKFLADIVSVLTKLGVADSDIYIESFS